MTVDVPLPHPPTPLPEQTEAPEAVLPVGECAARVTAAVEALAAIDPVKHQLTTTDLAELTQSVLAVFQLAESAAAVLTGAAIARGIIGESTAAGPAQWVTRLGAGEPLAALLPDTGPTRTSGPLVPLEAPSSDDDGSEGTSADGAEPDEASADEAASDRGGDGFGHVAGQRVPGLEPGVVSRIVKVATACTQPKHTVLADALTSNRVGLSAARTALVEVAKLLPVLPHATHDVVYRHFLALPPGSGSRAIRELATRVIATFADEESLNDADSKLDAAESVTWQALPGGMERLTADLTRGHAAHVRHALNALSAPAPGNTCCDNPFHRHTGDPTGDPDPRTTEKRAADALMLLITTAATLIDNDTAVTTSGQARIVVTINYQTLVDQLRQQDPADQDHDRPPGGGPPGGPGFGTTEAGTALHPEHIRQLACDADIIPMVLGSHGEPLNVGREQRLVKHGMRTAVIQRDQHCTYPGCTRPPAWCHIHHVIPWQHGGPTSLDNAALLCPRHPHHRPPRPPHRDRHTHRRHLEPHPNTHDQLERVMESRPVVPARSGPYLTCGRPRPPPNLAR